jgi:hypothetical protein
VHRLKSAVSTATPYAKRRALLHGRNLSWIRKTKGPSHAAYSIRSLLSQDCTGQISAASERFSFEGSHHPYADYLPFDESQAIGAMFYQMQYFYFGQSGKIMIVKLERIYALALGASILGLTACGGASSSGSSSGSSGSSASSSSSASGSGCNYADKITASERSQASACGIQVSGNYAQADSGLASVISACQAGQKATADAYYAGTYQQMVTYARSVSATLSCGTNTAPTLPNTSTQTYYNFCVKNLSISTTPSYSGSCYGPVQQGDGGCASGNYISQYSSNSSCQSAGQAWLNSH